RRCARDSRMARRSELRGEPRLRPGSVLAREVDLRARAGRHAGRRLPLTSASARITPAAASESLQRADRSLDALHEGSLPHQPRGGVDLGAELTVAIEERRDRADGLAGGA